MDFSDKTDAQLRGLAKRVSTPVETLIQLSVHENSTVRKSVAQNPNTPPQILFTLSQDDDLYVSAYAYNNPNIPNTALTAIVHDERIKVMLRIIKINLRNQKTLNALAHHKDYRVRVRAVNFGLLSPQILHDVAVNEKTTSVAKNLAQKANLLPETIELLSRNKNFEVRQLIASHIHTPQHILKNLSQDKEQNVVVNVAQNKTTSPPILSDLINQQMHIDVLHALVTRTDLNEEDYLKLVDVLQTNRVKWDGFDAATIQDRALCETNTKFFLLARNEKNSARVIDKLSENDDILLCSRHGLSGNHNISSQVAEKIFYFALENENFETLVELGRNPSLSETLIREYFAVDKKCYSVIDNPNTPVDILRYFFDKGNLRNKTKVVQALWRADPEIKDWPKEWVEEHFGIKFIQTYG